MLECEFDKCDFKGKPVDGLLKFLGSLGFDATKKYDGPTGTVIDTLVLEGLDIEPDYSQAPSMGKNAYSREEYPRKRRQIRLKISHDISCIIPINKPTDKTRLVDLLNKAINKIKQRNLDYANKEAKTEEFLKSIYKHYSPLNGLVNLGSIKVNDGITTIVIIDVAVLTIDNDGKITGCDVKLPEIDTLDEALALPATTKKIVDQIIKIKSRLDKIGHMPINDLSMHGSVSESEGELVIR